MTDFFFSQSGRGAQNGTTEANAWSIATVNGTNWATLGLAGGDSLKAVPDLGISIPTFTTALTIGQANPTATSRLLVELAHDGNASIFNVSSNYAIVAGTRSYVTVQNAVANGRGIFSLTMTAGNVNSFYCNNLISYNSTVCGCLMQTSDTQASYGIATDIIFDGCQAYDAALHGIGMIAALNRCWMRNCHVDGAAVTGGNLWGIYLSPHGVFTEATGWTNGGGTVWTKTLSAIGLTGSPAVAGVVYHGIEPQHLVLGTYGALSSGQYAVSAGTLQINVPISPNSGEMIGVLTQHASASGIEFCTATNVSNNGGTTDGVGIGLDHGATDCVIRGVRTWDNEGKGTEMMWADGCRVEGSVSINDGVWGHHINGCGAVGNSIINSVAVGNVSGVDPSGFRVNNCGAIEQKIVNNIAVNCALGFGNDLSSTNITQTTNAVENCTVQGFSSVVTTAPLFLSSTDFRLKPTSPCIRTGASIDQYTHYGADGIAFRKGTPSIGAYEQEFRTTITMASGL